MPRKSVDELFDVDAIIMIARDAQEAFKRGEYIGEWGDVHDYVICTIVSECWGCKQPGALAEWMELTYEDLDMEEPEEEDGEDFIDRVSKIEWIYDHLEVECDHLADDLEKITRKKAPDLEGRFYLGWSDGAVVLSYICDLMEEEEDEEDE